MTQKPNSEMLILAREVRGLTQAQLAELSGVDQGSISRYEAALKEIPDFDLKRLVTTLEFPVEFFLQDGKRYGAETGEIFHRKRNTLPIGQLKRIQAQLNIFRLNVERLLEPFRSPKHIEIPQYNAREYSGDIEYVAALVRSAWHLPATGHIPDLIALLESAYCFIHPMDFETHLIDETVQWCEPGRPVILVNSRSSGERLRFTLAHTLGHLVLHHYREPYEGMEDEADRFAGAFLMPAEDMKNQLKDLTLERLFQLKPYWQVSMQALIERAFELGTIKEPRKKTLYQSLSRSGYLRNEPFPLTPEKPTSLNRVIESYRKKKQLADAEIAGVARISLNDFRTWYLPDESFLRVVYKPKYGTPSNRPADISRLQQTEKDSRKISD